MQYYQPRQLESGGWHMTARWDDDIRPVGDCKEHGGHETKEAAIQCYHNYQIREHLSFMKSDAHRECKECGELTQWWAGVRHGGDVPLCEDHQTQEMASKHLEPIRRMAASY